MSAEKETTPTPATAQSQPSSPCVWINLTYGEEDRSIPGIRSILAQEKDLQTVSNLFRWIKEDAEPIYEIRCFYELQFPADVDTIIIDVDPRTKIIKKDGVTDPVRDNTREIKLEKHPKRWPNLRDYLATDDSDLTSKRKATNITVRMISDKILERIQGLHKSDTPWLPPLFEPISYPDFPTNVYLYVTCFQDPRNIIFECPKVLIGNYSLGSIMTIQRLCKVLNRNKILERYLVISERVHKDLESVTIWAPDEQNQLRSSRFLRFGHEPIPDYHIFWPSWQYRRLQCDALRTQLKLSPIVVEVCLRALGPSLSTHSDAQIGTSKRPIEL